MAWHKRHVSSIADSGLRLSIQFQRPDLLWVSPAPIVNPRTGEEVSLPLRPSEKIAVGPNILDLLVRETRLLEQVVEFTASDGSKQTAVLKLEKLIWCQRSPFEFFPQRPVEVGEEHPLHKSYCTGGTVVRTQGDFIAVTKRSSVSINSLVYRLAVGMTGSELAASQTIAQQAAAAWQDDLERAQKLYDLIAAAPAGYILDEEVPPQLKAGASIGQIVETSVLTSACRWLGIDPNAPLRRQRGRPRTRQRDEAERPVSSGKVIELTLQDDGSVTGRLIAQFQGLPTNTVLAALSSSKLAEILVALRQAELIEDADLLEAYLDAADAEWRAKIAAEIGSEENNRNTNPWMILGLSPGASLAEVKRAYKQVMRVVHPDMHPDTSGLPKWFAQTVNEAYRQLLEELADDE